MGLLRRGLTGLAALALAGALLPGARAAEPTVIRVGYPIQSGLTERSENGKYSGYTYEYLEEIAQYRGWEYEFVEVPGTLDESLGTLMDMLERGEIDLMGGMTYSESLAEVYDYVDQSYGNAYTVLSTLSANSAITPENYQTMQGMRVAAIATAQTRQRELESFCESNGISYRLVLCDSDEEMVAALKEGRADTLLSVDMNPLEEVRTVTRFSPRAFYFVTTKGNTELVRQMNSAISNIDQVDPYFSATLYERYFGAQWHGTLTLSDDELAYISGLGPLKAGFVQDRPPFQYRNEAGEPVGISKEVLDYIAGETGLEFEWVFAESELKLKEMLQKDEVDLAAGITFDYELAKEYDVSLTRPYTSAQYIILLGQGVNVDSLAGKRLAMAATTTYQGDYRGDVVWYEGVDACINAVNSGQADYTYVDGYVAQYYINLPQYRNIRLTPLTYSPRETCVGVVRPADVRLLSILNKSIISIPEETMQAIVYRNTVYRSSFSPLAVIQAYPTESVTVILCLAVLIIAVLIGNVHVRGKRSKRTAMELKKHYQLYELSSERFFEYDFQTKELVMAETGGVKVYGPAKAGLVGPRAGDWKRFTEFIRGREDGVVDMTWPQEDGSERWFRLTTRRICDKDGAPVYLVGKIADIDEEKRERGELMDQAQKDGLTQLYNPAKCRELIQERLARGGPGAMLVIDVDRFKQINDGLGHYTGDQVLQQVAELLRATCRREDIVGRLGGDEFVVYMDRVPDRRTVERRCADLVERVREGTAQGTRVSVSVGAAMTEAGQSYETLYQRADEALYAAKEAGRDRYHLN